jgi:hypothetical protein
MRRVITIGAAAVLCASAATAQQQVVASQSFNTRFKGFGAVRFVTLRDTAGGPAKCRFELRRGGRTLYRFPAARTDQWSCFDVTAISFRDVNGDGRKDVLVLATAITGIGPTGAQPFQANTVYYNTGAGRFVTNGKVNAFASKSKTARTLTRALARSRYARFKAR